MTADLLMSSLEKIRNLIEELESESSGFNGQSIDDLRVCMKMNLFLMFFFLRNTRIKRSKNSLKDEIHEATNQLSKNEKKKTKTIVLLFTF